MKEHQAGLREESVISTSTVESAEDGDEAAWYQIGRELEDVGISASMIQENRAFIVAWMKNALDIGQLEEQAGELEEMPKKQSQEQQDHSRLSRPEVGVNASAHSLYTMYFLPGLGTAHHIISSNIQLFLGPQTSVRPFSYQGREGYLVGTHGRPLTVVSLSSSVSCFDQESISPRIPLEHVLTT